MLIFEVSLLGLILLAIISILFTSIKTGITPMWSSKKAISVISDIVGKSGEGKIYDLGSGWGNLLIAIARHYPQRQVTGYELSLVPFLFSLFMKKIWRLENLVIYRNDFLKSNFENGSVLVCYLHPEAMKSLAEKIDSEGQVDLVIISNSFRLRLAAEKGVEEIKRNSNPDVYEYRIQSNS